MDFTNRSGQPRTSAPDAQHSGNVTAPTHNDNKPRRARFDNNLWFKLASVVLLFSGTILVVAVLFFINFGSPSHENKYVAKNDYQAVFINVTGVTAGAVYFGHITDLSDDFIRLNNVFYIQKPSDTSKDANLIKLGCEIHGPEDEMVINRDQVFFWENLKPSGEVTKKIAEWYKANPSGQKCADSSSSSTQQGSSNVTNNAATPNTTTNTTNNTSTNSTPKTNTGTTPKQ